MKNERGSRVTVSALEKATPGDRDAIVALVTAVVDCLNQSGIPQWDDVYPNAETVDEDLRNGQLYVVRGEAGIAGIVTLNREFDPAYKNGDWSYRGQDFAVVHRLCVAPAMQGQGVGRRIMRMVEAMLKDSGVQSVRLDAFSQNPYSLRLYEKLGYRVTGRALWRKGLFYLMEKTLGESAGS